MANHDPLVLLRQSISTSKPFHPISSPSPDSLAVELAAATHLAFPEASTALPISTSTRFVSNDKSVDLRSIYFAWLNRERAIPEYNAAATALNDSLGEGAKVQNLGFIERLDLITWLEGASEESEYIKPLAGAAGDASAGEGGVVTAAKVGVVSSAAQARSGKGTIDPRLASIYNGERRMGDRNTVLRGIKPTVSYLFSLLAEIPMLRCSGLLPRSQTRCAFSRPQANNHSRQCPQSRHQPKGTRQTPRPNHSSLSLRFSPHTSLKRAFLPSRGPLHAP